MSQTIKDSSQKKPSNNEAKNNINAEVSDLVLQDYNVIAGDNVDLDFFSYLDETYSEKSPGVVALETLRDKLIKIDIINEENSPFKDFIDTCIKNKIVRSTIINDDDFYNNSSNYDCYLQILDKLNFIIKNNHIFDEKILAPAISTTIKLSHNISYDNRPDILKDICKNIEIKSKNNLHTYSSYDLSIIKNAFNSFEYNEGAAWKTSFEKRLCNILNEHLFNENVENNLPLNNKNRITDFQISRMLGYNNNISGGGKFFAAKRLSEKTKDILTDYIINNIDKFSVKSLIEVIKYFHNFDEPIKRDFEQAISEFFSNKIKSNSNIRENELVKIYSFYNKACLQIPKGLHDKLEKIIINNISTFKEISFSSICYNLCLQSVLGNEISKDCTKAIEDNLLNNKKNIFREIEKHQIVTFSIIFNSQNVREKYYSKNITKSYSNDVSDKEVSFINLLKKSLPGEASCENGFFNEKILSTHDFKVSIGDFNFIIEYDGKQHFNHDGTYNSKTLLQNRLVEKYLESNEFLIRVPYFLDKNEAISKILDFIDEKTAPEKLIPKPILTQEIKPYSAKSDLLIVG